ncbi:MAG: hypothetical protein H0T67_08385 [Burkholderiaceae bacterium]|nr:hypothetical protein [Burkholderiaceae bacterium]
MPPKTALNQRTVGGRVNDEHAATRRTERAQLLEFKDAARIFLANPRRSISTTRVFDQRAQRRAPRVVETEELADTKAPVRIGFGIERMQPNRKLLLLVFSSRSALKDCSIRVAERWRFEGPVAMIAGAKLALRSVDLDEALAFVRRKSNHATSPAPPISPI